MKSIKYLVMGIALSVFFSCAQDAPLELENNVWKLIGGKDEGSFVLYDRGEHKCYTVRRKDNSYSQEEAPENYTLEGNNIIKGGVNFTYTISGNTLSIHILDKTYTYTHVSKPGISEIKDATGHTKS